MITAIKHWVTSADIKTLYLTRKISSQEAVARILHRELSIISGISITILVLALIII